MTPIEDRSRLIYMSDHPQLEAMLQFRMTGGTRQPYFHARQGMQQAVLDYINGELGDRMLAVSAETALNSGLFGPPPHAPETVYRIGDVVGIMYDGYGFLNANERAFAQRIQGAHGGLSAAEMRVPWVVARY